MVFKIKRILTERELRRAKYTTGFVSILLLLQFAGSYFATAKKTQGEIVFNGKNWETMMIENYPRGRIVYFSSNIEVCTR